MFTNKQALLTRPKSGRERGGGRDGAAAWSELSCMTSDYMIAVQVGANGKVTPCPWPETAAA